MRRLSATGLLMFSQGAQTLYRSAALPVEKTVTAGDENLGPLAIVQAIRILQMAKVLAAGGFGEEARPLLAKSLQSAAVALNTIRGLGTSGAVGDADEFDVSSTGRPTAGSAMGFRGGESGVGRRGDRRHRTWC